MLTRTLLYLALVYALLVLVMFALQRKLLYFPDTRPFDQVRVAPGLQAWPSQREFRGWRVEPADGDARATVVVFHGNAGAASDRAHYAPALGRLGYRVILAEYPGYAGRPGSPSEATLVADARDTLLAVRSAFPGPVIAWGESLGAGVAAAALADPAVPVDGLVLLTPWSSLTELAGSLYWYLPARWLLRDRYDSITHLARFEHPVTVVVAERDEIVPARLGRKLFDSLGTKKSFLVLRGAGHNNWPVAANAPWWAQALGVVAPGVHTPINTDYSK